MTEFIETRIETLEKSIAQVIPQEIGRRTRRLPRKGFPQLSTSLMTKTQVKKIKAKSSARFMACADLLQMSK